MHLKVRNMRANMHYTRPIAKIKKNIRNVHAKKMFENLACYKFVLPKLNFYCEEVYFSNLNSQDKIDYLVPQGVCGHRWDVDEVAPFREHFVDSRTDVDV